MTSLLSTSSFFCTSPWTLTDAAIVAGIAQRADQGALVDLVGNDLDRRGQRIEQAGKLARGARMLVFLPRWCSASV
jgi:hypothetical protein